jgi:hypothetical protein
LIQDNFLKKYFGRSELISPGHVFEVFGDYGLHGADGIDHPGLGFLLHIHLEFAHVICFFLEKIDVDHVKFYQGGVPAGLMVQIQAHGGFKVLTHFLPARFFYAGKQKYRAQDRNKQQTEIFKHGRKINKNLCRKVLNKEKVNAICSFNT